MFWGSYRCEKWGKREASLHAENRAIDWHLDAGSSADRRAADELIELLLATDAAGNTQALARRMGVEELIWDCEYWAAGMPEFQPYPRLLRQAREAPQAREHDRGAPRSRPHRHDEGRRRREDVVLARAYWVTCGRRCSSRWSSPARPGRSR